MTPEVETLLRDVDRRIVALDWSLRRGEVGRGEFNDRKARLSAERRELEARAGD